MSQTLIDLSWDPVKRLLVTNENLQALIVSLCPVKVYATLIVLSLQRRILCSVEAPARYSLSIEKETSVMALLKPFKH